MQQVRWGARPVVVAIAALFVAVVVAVWLAPTLTGSSGTAAAEVAPGTTGDAQITIFVGNTYSAGTCPAPPREAAPSTKPEYADVVGCPSAGAREDTLDFTIDGTRYPRGLVAALDPHLRVESGSYCVRLYDLTINEAVAGSESCLTKPVDKNNPNRARLQERVKAAKLAAVAHDYTLQSLKTGEGWVVAARLYLSWS